MATLPGRQGSIFRGVYPKLVEESQTCAIEILLIMFVVGRATNDKTHQLYGQRHTLTKNNYALQ
jgi:hypothetical protein